MSAQTRSGWVLDRVQGFTATSLGASEVDSAYGLALSCDLEGEVVNGWFHVHTFWRS
jgi:hypothetical protein